MTVETFTPAAPYTVAGIGPYAIDHPYLEGSIRVFTTVGEVEVQLPPTDYSLSPLAATVAGNLFLTPAAAAAQAGRALRIRRVTAQEQGWVGVLGEREKGLERQLDRLTYAVQEGSALLDRTLRTRDPIAPFVPQTGRTLLFDGTAIVAGPNAMDIADAQENAAAALASQVAAAGSAAAAAGSASQAAASAATINLPAITGQALNFLRANSGATGLEYRTPAQVRSDLGLPVDLIAQGALSGSELIIAIPSAFDGIELSHWGYTPSTNGTVLRLAIGSGTIGSPTWGANHYEQVQTVQNTTYVPGAVGPSGFVNLSFEQLGAGQIPGSGRVVANGFHAVGVVYGDSVRRGANASGRATSHGSLAEETQVVHTLIRIFVSAGTMSGSYRLLGYRKP